MGWAFIIFMIIIAFSIFLICKENGDLDNTNQVNDSTNRVNNDSTENNANVTLYNCRFLEDTLVRLSKRYIAVDFETTGLNPKTDRIIEIGAVLFVNGKPADTFSTLVNPGISIPARATEINHISNTMVMSAPSEAVAFSQFVDFLGNALNSKTILCAHNADFDMHFLGETLIRLGYSGSLDSVDTLAVSRKMVTDVENYKLTTLSRHFNIDIGNAHRASLDALACGKLLAIFLDKKKDEIAECERKQADLEQKRKEYLENRKMIEISPKNNRKSINSIPVINIFDSAYDRGYALFKEAEEIRKGKTDYLKAIELYDKSRETGFCTVGLYESYAMTYRKLKDYDNEIAILDEGITRLKDRNENYTSLEERRNKAVCSVLNNQAKEKEKIEKEKAKQLKLQAKNEELAIKQQNKKPQGKRVIQMTDDMEIVNVYNSISEAARAVGVDTKGISSAAKGIQKHSGGFLWKFEEN